MISSETKIAELLARAFASKAESQLREVMTEVLASTVQSYECRAIFDRLVAPIATMMFKELMQREEFKKLLATRVEQQLQELLANMRIDVSNGHSRR